MADGEALENKVMVGGKTLSLDFDTVEEASWFFSGLYTWLGLGDFPDIWPDTKTCLHMMNKWKDAEYRLPGIARHDLWIFYTSLDEQNRQKLVAWYNTRCSEWKAKGKQ